jgi:branched-chain amino acid transport system ATP-binding protein
LLSARGLTRDFGGLRAVDNVDFDLPEGQIRALIGPNGAGKTTFVSLLCGRIPASAGAITFEGQDVTRLPAHERVAMGIAYTFQITSIYANLSVYDNVALAVQRGFRGSAARLRAAVTDALDRVGLAARGGQVAGDLSYGHQRLLEIAMGLGQRPRLLILDEPTQGLADAEIDAFETLVREVAVDATVLLIEHNMKVVMALADYVTVLDFGAVLAEGRPEAIRADPAVQAAYLGG